MPQDSTKTVNGIDSNGAPSIIPIADIEDGAKTTKHEIELRCKLAALYRIIDQKGWTLGIYNHISARINETDEHFLLNPLGLLYSEVTASSLVKIDLDGNILEQGSTSRDINKAGFVLHSAIHESRPDVMCIIHVHTGDAVAVSAMKCGFLPLSQESAIIGEVSYHDYCGILVDEKEKQAIQQNLGPKNKVMFLRNHGVVVCGETVEEAWYIITMLMEALESQVKAMPAGLENLILIKEEVQRKTFQIASAASGGVSYGKQDWKRGELEFEAAMRQLDNAGYKTGYPYKQTS